MGWHLLTFDLYFIYILLITKWVLENFIGFEDYYCHVISLSKEGHLSSVISLKPHSKRLPHQTEISDQSTFQCGHDWSFIITCLQMFLEALQLTSNPLRRFCSSLTSFPITPWPSFLEKLCESGHVVSGSAGKADGRFEETSVFWFL